MTDGYFRGYLKVAYDCATLWKNAQNPELQPTFRSAFGAWMLTENPFFKAV